MTSGLIRSLVDRAMGANAARSSSSNDGSSSVAGGSGECRKFHRNCGQNVRLLKDGRAAERFESFCKGLAFSAAPFQVDDVICLKLIKTAVNWSGVLRIGVTNTDPGTFDTLPKFACPDLTSKEGTWGKALPERYCTTDNVIHFYVNETGEMYYGVNGIGKGMFLSGINTSLPMYVLVDIYGNSTAVEFIDPADARFRPSRHPLGAPRRRSTHDVSPQQPQPARNSTTVEVAAPVNRSRSTATQNTSPPARAHRPAPTLPPPPPVPSLRTLPQPRFNASQARAPLPFHAVCGKNVTLSAERNVAARSEPHYDQGYIFTSRPLEHNEEVLLQVVNTNAAFSGSLALGVTCCDPSLLRPANMPADADDWLERSEYWACIKNVAGNQPKPTDELAFLIDPQGRVKMRINNNAWSVLMHVDETQRLWMFWDLYGSTQCVRSLGVCAAPPPGTSSDRPQTAAAPAPAPASGSSSLRVALPPRRAASGSTLTQSTGSSPVHSPHPNNSVASSASASGSRNMPPVPPPRTGAVAPRRSVAAPGLDGSLASSASSDQLAAKQVTSPRPSSSKLAADFDQLLVLDDDPPLPPSAPPEPDDRDDCQVCMNERADAVLYTCGHLCMCFSCANETWTRQGSCPICRKSITDIIRVFKS